MADSIAEVTKMISDSNRIQKDIEEALQVLREFLKDKYINVLNEAVISHHKKALDSPSKEVRLFLAMREFVPDDNRETIDKIINLFLVANSLKSMSSEINDEENTVTMPQMIVLSAMLSKSIPESVYTIPKA